MERVRVGDIGPKFGFNSSDNGFLLFNNYRIPRKNMLMRYSKVEKDGTFVAPKHSKSGEVQILDYQTQQFRLFPQLARAFAFMFAAYEIRDLYMKKNLDRLPNQKPLVGGCTYEGENIVMLLQVARFLMKAAEEVRRGSAKLAAICDYIGKQGSRHSSLKSWDKYSDEEIIHDFEHVARNQVFRAYDVLKRHQRESTLEEGWNRASIELCKASRVRYL
ncbi:unnamed protein product [Cylicostephanus goldi]|uniref:Acyl-CoA oxidase C-alpha1 domain-containing protein n=1 Tax=Cylicostephanus goldi TaxID=71465 RepID=A0A3P7MT85_CYLGO|nr:unnamed protein product [Cylicostephanus goldi]